MGCGQSGLTPSKAVSPLPQPPGSPKSETALSAAMLIQRWYRRYMARLELRRQFYWKIFQTIEFSSEQDQLKLYNFFYDMLAHVQLQEQGSSSLSRALRFRATPSLESTIEDEELMELTDPEHISISSSYKGPHIKMPMTSNQLESLIHAFKKRQMLHAKYLLQIMHAARKLLKKAPNIYQASTDFSKQITICGDLHGKYDDLLIIFYKNGVPSASNPYVFNGDFVDRGPHSVEIACVLFACVCLCPNEVFLNRGNHEDHVMNLRYGFIKEVMAKYKEHATKVLRLFEDIFSWLPLATVIDGTVLVTHGGISDKTDLDKIDRIDRHQYISALKPPTTESGGVNYDEWRQVLDLLWSDPKSQAGCKPNTFRGGGCYFGPDVTERVLEKHNLSLLVRSHECKPEGYQYTHNNKVLTIFSASNYYEIGSNKGAYVKLQSNQQPHIVQYMATRGHRGLSASQRVGISEGTALYSLKEKIIAHQSVLMDNFKKYDKNSKGLIRVHDWCLIMANVLKLELPWRSLRSKLVQTSDKDPTLVKYPTTFEDFKISNKFKESQSDVTETLYRNKENLETIFRAIDKDNSGQISMDEFREACCLLGRHRANPIPEEEILDMAHAMDMNKDGFIDFNEFLEAFRIVNSHGTEYK